MKAWASVCGLPQNVVVGAVIVGQRRCQAWVVARTKKAALLGLRTHRRYGHRAHVGLRRRPKPPTAYRIVVQGNDARGG